MRQIWIAMGCMVGLLGGCNEDRIASICEKNVITSYSIHYTKLYEMDGLSLLLERHSCGRLVAPAPQGAALENILQAALAAPDHGGLHPWHFILCEGDGRERLGALLAAAAESYNFV